jgi:glycine cleavage system H lipoate-binding protein/ABC-type phosphate transport system substrate-binding protein
MNTSDKIHQTKITKIMKKLILLVIATILLCSGNLYLKKARASSSPQDKPIIVMSTPDLYDLTNKWSSEYCKMNPGLTIKVIEITDDEMPEIFNAGSNIGFISEKYAQKHTSSSSLWQLSVGREVIVPVININNPLLEQLFEMGMTPETLAKLVTNPDMMDWSAMLENMHNSPIHYYTTNETAINSSIAEFLKVEPNTIQGQKMGNREDLIIAVQNDPLAIGFCLFSDIIDSQSQKLVENIQLLPIDKNKNGQIDHYENIYADVFDFTRGVWIGKYPKVLINDIYAVSSAKTFDANEITFLKWVLTDGQETLLQNGYSDLVFGERQMKLDKLRNDIIFTEASNEQNATLKIILFTVIGIVLLSFIGSGLIRNRLRKQEIAQANKPSTFKQFNENSIDIPYGLYFDKSHTWAFMEMQGIVKVGIDDFLQHITGPITRTIIKNTGEKIKKGDHILTLVQNGKQLNIYAPLSGTIKDVNEELMENPSILNTSPYNEGWIYKIEPSNWLREVEFLKMAENYKQWLINEFTRLKDFIVTSTKLNSTALSPVILQEGGELKDNVLEEFGPATWEEFQKQFLDAYQLR